MMGSLPMIALVMFMCCSWMVIGVGISIGCRLLGIAISGILLSVLMIVLGEWTGE